MGQRWRRNLLVAAFLALAVPVGSSDAPFAFEVQARSTGPGVIHGVGFLAATLDGIAFSAGGSDDASEVVLDLQDARVRLVNQPQFVTGSAKEAPVGQQSASSSLPERVIWEKNFTGTIRKLAPNGIAHYVVKPAPGLERIDVGILGAIGATLAPVARESSPRTDYGDPLDPRWRLPEAASALLWNRDLGLSVSATNASALLYGGVFLLEANGLFDEVRTGKSLNQTETVTDPNGWFGRWAWDQVALEINARTIDARLSGGGGSAWSLLAGHVEGALTGSLFIGQVVGSVQTGGNKSAVDSQTLEIDGQYGFSASVEQGTTWVWDIGGKAAFIAVDGARVVGEQPGGAPSLVLTASAVGLAAALYLAFSVLRRGAAYVAVKSALPGWATAVVGSARLAAADALRNLKRNEIFELLVQEYPYVRLKDLLGIAAQRLRMSRLGVYYHLRHLSRAGLLEILVPQRGRSVFVAPNDGFSRNPGAKAAMMLTADPVGRLVAEALVTVRPAVQADVIRFVQKRIRSGTGTCHTSISRPAVLKWIRKFEGFAYSASSSRPGPSQSGAKAKSVLIERRTHGRGVTYSPSAVLREIVAARANGPDAVVRAIRSKLEGRASAAPS